MEEWFVFFCFEVGVLFLRCFYKFSVVAVFHRFCNYGIGIVDIKNDVVSVAPVVSESASTSLVSVEFARL